MRKPRFYFHRIYHEVFHRSPMYVHATNFGIRFDFLEWCSPSRSFSWLPIRLCPSVSFVVAARRVKSCFVERKQLPERFKKGKEDHDVFPLSFLSLSSISLSLSLSLSHPSFSLFPSLFLVHSSSPGLMARLAP